ncbi:MAG: type II toxin-antitoxin system HicB family antitoxin [Bacteroidia bacterium]|nr:type II toxin-antitoxin system HicB family antitoxin [Bacteroidia bacterium]
MIERAEDNFSAYVKEVDGITTTGKTIDEIKTSMIEAIDEFIATCKELHYEIPSELNDEFEISFQMDIQSLLQIYQGIFTKSGLERLTGINQKQLWHYAKGLSVPRQAQKQKIENALHKLGNELLSLSL